MTLDDLLKIDRDWLLTREVAPLLGCDAQDIRVAAKVAPEKLGFPVCVIRSRVKIPRKPFLRFMGVDN